MRGDRWQEWVKLEGKLAGTGTAVAHEGVRVDVLARGEDGHLWCRSYDGASWAARYELAGGLASDPVAVAAAPLRFEPFGLVQIEAMAMGSLPIASATGGHKDVIVDMGHDGCFGRLFPPGDAAALGRAVEEMTRLRREQPDEVNSMRIRAAAAAHRYSDQAMARRYEELYESVLSRRPGCAGRTASERVRPRDGDR